jgi:HSP20 family protein
MSMYLVPWSHRRHRLALGRFLDSPLDLFQALAVPTDSQRGWGFEAQDHEKEVVVRAELPGFEPDDLHVQVHEDVLTVKAEKKEAEGQRSYRKFFRSVTLPTGVEAEKAQATYRNGVLELHLPKTEKAQPRRIPVHAEHGQPQATGDAPPVVQ